MSLVDDQNGDPAMEDGSFKSTRGGSELDTVGRRISIGDDSLHVVSMPKCSRHAIVRTYIGRGKNNLMVGLAKREDIIPPGQTLRELPFVAQYIDGTGCHKPTDFSFPLREQRRRTHNKCDSGGIEKIGRAHV